MVICRAAGILLSLPNAAPRVFMTRNTLMTSRGAGFFLWALFPADFIWSLYFLCFLALLFQWILVKQMQKRQNFPGGEFAEDQHSVTNTGARVPLRVSVQ